MCHQLNGRRGRVPPRISIGRAAAWAEVVTCAIMLAPSLSIAGARINQAPLDDRHNEYDYKEQDRHRRRQAEMSIIEGGIVNLQHRSQRRVERPSIGHEFSLVEHLEAPDSAKRDHQEDSWAQERHGD